MTADKINHVIFESDTDEKAFLETAKFYRHGSEFDEARVSLLNVLYRAARGDVDMRDYSSVLNPRGVDNKKFQRWPAKIRNYNIITPILNLLMGEFITGGTDVVTVATDNDSVNRFDESRKKAVIAAVSQMYVNELNASGAKTGMPSKDVGSLEDIYTNHHITYKDVKAIEAAGVIDFLKNRFMDKVLLICFYDWLVSGSAFTFKLGVNNDVVYYPIDPRNIRVYGHNFEGNVEDAEAASIRLRLTLSEIQSMFNLSKKDLQDRYDDIRGTDLMFNAAIDDIENTTDLDQEQGINNTNLRTVYFETWRGKREIGILKYYNHVLDEIMEMEVTRDYEFSPELGDISIDWQLKDNICFAFSDEEDNMLSYGFVNPQRSDINSNSDGKLPVNGAYYGFRNTKPMSVVATGLDYQILHNIIGFRLEFITAVHKGPYVAMPKSFFNENVKDGWTLDKVMYYTDVTRIFLYDDSDPAAVQKIAGIKTLDVQLGTYVTDLLGLMQRFKDMYWDEIGMNRQRYGDSYASDGKSVTEQASFRSAVLTVHLFHRYDQFMEAEYTGVVDIAANVWPKGKRAAYNTSDNTRAFIIVKDPTETLADIGVFVKRSADEKSKVAKAQELLLTLAQNPGSGDGIISALDARSVAQIKEIIAKAVEAERAYNMQLEQIKADGQKDAAAKQLEAAQIMSADKRYVADKQYQAMIDAKMIDKGMSVTDLFNDTINKINEMVEGGTLRENDNNKLRDLVNGLEAAQQKANNDRMKLEASMAKSADAVKIAETNRNRYDK